MIRILETKYTQDHDGDKYLGTKYVEMAGLSTDTKPTEKLITGSLFMEADTGDIYVFDEVSKDWTKIGG